MTIGLRHASFGLPSTAFNAPFKSPGVIQPSHTVWKSSVSQKSKQRVFLHVRKITRHSYPVALALLTQALQKVTFHAGETAVTVPLSNEAAVELRNSINNLLQTFQKKAAAAKPQDGKVLNFSTPQKMVLT